MSEMHIIRRRHWTLGAAAALLALGLPARAEDEGDFVILSARYGTEQRNVDVTERLRELARQDRRMRLSNELFGVDPDPGRTKTLRIFARDRQGQERLFEFRERDWIDGAQFMGWAGGRWGDRDARGWRGAERRDDGEYTILGATYGTARREVDVTARLRELARGDLRLRLTNDLFGVDPDPGRTKTLRILARDRRGQERRFDYPEYAWVDGAQFNGWSRGDWGPMRPAPSRLVIDSASYGVDGRWADVTAAVRAMVRGDRLDVEVRNELFGIDPAPGRTKTLSVTYRFNGEPPNTVRANEQRRIRLP